MVMEGCEQADLVDIQNGWRTAYRWRNTVYVSFINHLLLILQEVPLQRRGVQLPLQEGVEQDRRGAGLV